MTTEILKLRVEKITQEAADIRSYEFRDPEGGDLPAFTAGAHIDVHLPGGLLRQYSLCNDPSERYRYVVAVLREASGRGGSIDMHDSVREGDIVNASPPLNNFPVSKEAKRHILLAGGIGITPVLAMVRHLEAEGEDYQLHYCTRSEDKTAFFDLLSKEPFASKVTFYFDGGNPANGMDVQTHLRPFSLGDHVYCCGPVGFMNAVRDAAAHWPTGTVHFEYFSVDPALAAGSGVDELFEVEIESSGEIYQIPEDKSVLDILRDAGHDLPSACEEGICGTCITEVASGDIDHRDMVLDDDEREAGDLMTICCSRGRGRIVLKL
ncbi:MAG: PDR/VanB family oxidoreductase [Kiloniellales bacterium]|nr:PDR/VanB family oxidoreductase [Kiloniellales bacterium]